ncbi:PfkB family carbohydrate kinase [Parabacteroides sp. OttesenSCG-928-N08]|nr:PfkB family carbohydrate kinase [Parabacteroides sp. OttesenSCG-928-N08]
MKKHELCCVGHITLDKVVTPKSTVFMPGGTSYYFSQGIKHFDDVDYILATALGQSEMSVVDKMRAEGMEVAVMPSSYSVYFENIYGENLNERTQRVLAKADPFTVAFMEGIEAEIYHLGSLLADDFPLELVEYLASKGRVAVDSQGFLREVRDQQVFAVDWQAKKEFLRHVSFLNVNEHEMKVLTGETEVKRAARQLAEWGVKEVVITLGDAGSVVYDGVDFYRIPAYCVEEVVDTTGCGDTYMTGFLYGRMKQWDIDRAGRFAAAMCSIKLGRSGPFTGTKEEVLQYMQQAPQQLPDID